MKVYQPCNSQDFKHYDTERIRKEFLVDDIFICGEINLVYSQFDRIIFGGAVPKELGIKLSAGSELRAEYFLQRREMGVINIGGAGTIIADGVFYEMSNKSCLYIGKGVKEVEFRSNNQEQPAYYYINSCPAHADYPTTHAPISEATTVRLGSKKDCNERTIYKFIYPEGIKSCQLVMGLTMLEEGSVWNTMPCHTHDRRMEVYLYFDVKKDAAVVHMMGDPKETRHLIIRDKEAVISPSWSIHSGCGTNNYSFIWGMCGENQAFDDMDGVKIEEMK